MLLALGHSPAPLRKSGPALVASHLRSGGFRTEPGSQKHFSLLTGLSIIDAD